MIKELKVISGGQTGADLAGLWAARVFGIETGGFAPKGWATHLGPKPQLARMFDLAESDGEYHSGSLGNCENSSVTLIFANDTRSPGTKLTIHHCISKRIHYRLFSFGEDPDEFASRYCSCIEQIIRNSIERGGHVLNISGNSTETASSSFVATFKTMCLAFEAITQFTPRILADHGICKVADKLKDLYEDDIFEMLSDQM